MKCIEAVRSCKTDTGRTTNQTSRSKFTRTYTYAEVNFALELLRDKRSAECTLAHPLHTGRAQKVNPILKGGFIHFL